jgi:hypothetical protein
MKIWVSLLLVIPCTYAILKAHSYSCTEEWSSWNGICPDGCSMSTQFRSRSPRGNCKEFLYESRQCKNNCKQLKLITLTAEHYYYQMGHQKVLDYDGSKKSFGSLMSCADSCEEFDIKDENIICIACLNYDDCKLMPHTSEVVEVDIIHTFPYSNTSDKLEPQCKCFLNLHSIPTKGLCDIEGYYTTYKIWVENE